MDTTELSFSVTEWIFCLGIRVRRAVLLLPNAEHVAHSAIRSNSENVTIL